MLQYASTAIFAYGAQKDQPVLTSTNMAACVNSLLLSISCLLIYPGQESLVALL